MTHFDLLDNIFGHWKENAGEAIANLGDEKCRLFIDVYNDAIEIQLAIGSTYSEDVLGDSLVYVDFMGVTKEIHWYMVMFLAGNSPLLLGRLHFIWELVFRALYAESYEKRRSLIRSRLSPASRRTTSDSRPETSWTAKISSPSCE